MQTFTFTSTKKRINVGNNNNNHNYNKIVISDWLSTALISALIGQFNRTAQRAQLMSHPRTAFCQK